MVTENESDYYDVKQVSNVSHFRVLTMSELQWR